MDGRIKTLESENATLVKDLGKKTRLVDSLRSRLIRKNRSLNSTGGSSDAPGNSDNVGQDENDKQLLDELKTMVIRGDVRWEKVAGMEQVKGVIKTARRIVCATSSLGWKNASPSIFVPFTYQAVIMPVRFPTMFQNRQEPYKRILLFGPPGTGKTYIANAVATEANCTFFSIRASSIGSKWKGEAERKVKFLFDLARQETRSVIFIDEIDALCGKRGGSIDCSDRKVLTEFLTQMDGVGGGQGNLVVLAATNTPWDLDDAVLDRFKKRIYVPLPDDESRLNMFKVHMGNTPSLLGEQDYKKLALSTEGASARDISALVEDASTQDIVDAMQSNFFRRQGELYEAVTCCSNCTKTSTPCSRCGARKLTVDDVPDDKLRRREVSMKDFEKNLRAYGNLSNNALESYGNWAAKYGA
ncbi:hypothetical protein ACHAWF_009827 [Thalassiosira exigua]